MRAVLIALVLSTALVAGCSPDETANPSYCEGDGDCAAGQRCYRHLCVTSDSGAADSAMADSAMADSAPADSAPADSAPADSAPLDTGTGCPTELCDGICCNSFETCCNDPSAGPTCVDVQTDSDHCGMCNHSCAATRCMSGTCL